jgi:hypothetical protein
MTEAPRLIRNIEPKSGYKVTIAWEGSPQSTVDLTDMIQKGGVFEALRNEKVFLEARVSENRRKIEWPEPADKEGEPLIDIDAESLHYLATQQRGVSLIDRLIGTMRSLDKARKALDKAPSD